MFGLHLNLGKKKGSTFGKDLFFGLHLICSPEQNRGRGSSPTKLKIVQNWGKIANYPPNAQQRSAPLAASLSSALLRDFEIVIPEKMQLLIDKSKVRCERSKQRRAQQSRDCALTSQSMQSLYFDSRKDKTE